MPSAPLVAPARSATRTPVVLPRAHGTIQTLLARAGAPVDIASEVFFRIAFGALMVGQLIYFGVEARQNWIDTPVHFTYYGFAWVTPPPPSVIYGVIAVVGVFPSDPGRPLVPRERGPIWHRIHVPISPRAGEVPEPLLLDLPRELCSSSCRRTGPCHSMPGASRDCAQRPPRRGRSGCYASSWPSCTRTPASPSSMQTGCRVNRSARGSARARIPVIGPLLQSEAAVYLICYGGLGFDLLVIPALLWQRTRAIAFAASVFFHLSNAVLFGLGVFPWMALGATTLFFAPDWPRRFLAMIPGAARLPLSVPRREAESAERNTPSLCRIRQSR